MARKMPEFSNRIRIKLDFVLDFDRINSIPCELVYNINAFIVGGLQAVIPVEEIEERFGDGRVLPNAHVNATHMTKAESARFDRQIAELRREHGLEEEQVERRPAPKRRGGAKGAKKKGAGGTGKKVPRVHKAGTRR